MKEITCAICGRKIKGSGNSCWPVFDEEKYRCCDECNMTVVVPERIWEAQQAQILEDNKLENDECY